MSDSRDSDAPFAIALAAGEKAVHVACHECPYEGLVVRHANLPDVERRGGDLARTHAETKRHRVSAEVVQE
jgi:hypothetical protein